MEKNSYVKAMNSLEPPQGMEQRIIQSCTAPQRKSRRWGKSLVAMATAFALMFTLVLGVPYFTKDQNGAVQMGVVSPMGLSLQVRAESTEEISTILFPQSGTSEPLTTNVLSFDPDNNTVNGGIGIDFILKGEGIKSIDYRSQFGDLKCDFDSQHIDENGGYIWTGFSAGMETEDYLTYVSDPENPKPEELVAAAKALEAAGELQHLREQMGLQESDPIDFTKVTLSGVVYQKMSSSMAFIHFENPEKAFVPPVDSVQEISGVAAGDYVTWFLPTDVITALQDKSREELDMSSYSETITISVAYQDGRSEVFQLQMQFGANGTVTSTVTRAEESN